MWLLIPCGSCCFLPGMGFWEGWRRTSTAEPALRTHHSPLCNRTPVVNPCLAPGAAHKGAALNERWVKATGSHSGAKGTLWC